MFCLGKFEGVSLGKECTLPLLSNLCKMNNNQVKSLAQEVAQQPPSKKKVQLVQEPIVLSDGSTMKPLHIKSSGDVLRASLLMLFKHVSDIHVTLVEIIAEKFGLSIEDIHKAINEDPRWAAMFVDPLLTDMTATIEENKVTKPKRKIQISDEPELIF